LCHHQKGCVCRETQDQRQEIPRIGQTAQRMDAVNEEHATTARALEYALTQTQRTLPVLWGERQLTEATEL